MKLSLPLLTAACSLTLLLTSCDTPSKPTEPIRLEETVLRELDLHQLSLTQQQVRLLQEVDENYRLIASGELDAARVKEIQLRFQKTVEAIGEQNRLIRSTFSGIGTQAESRQLNTKALEKSDLGPIPPIPPIPPDPDPCYADYACRYMLSPDQTINIFSPDDGSIFRFEDADGNTVEGIEELETKPLDKGVVLRSVQIGPGVQGEFSLLISRSGQLESEILIGVE